MSDPRLIRKEFEPKLISPFGYHLDAERCAERWNGNTWPDDDLARQIALATAWLRRVEKRKSPNKQIGTSYGLKHRVTGWLRGSGFQNHNCYVSNGCLLMAASRLGFVFKPIPSNYCIAGGHRRDGSNVFLNIASRSLPGIEPMPADVARVFGIHVA
jgi:hypothetical protein